MTCNVTRNIHELSITKDIIYCTPLSFKASGKYLDHGKICFFLALLLAQECLTLFQSNPEVSLGN